MESSDTLWKRIVKHRTLFYMFLPGFLLLLVFAYGPLYGLQIAFKDYQIFKGIWGSPWVGMKHFTEFFTNPDALQVLANTILISLYRLLWGFPAPIILAILINEIGNMAFKRVFQTISYLPHFISWIILSGMITKILSPSSGFINNIIVWLGGEPIFFMISKEWFRIILVVSGIWKEVGWGSIIYLAVLSGIDSQLYEAAIIDGANRLQRIWRITLPSLLFIVSILLILSMANILSAGFDQIFNMYNYQVYAVADIIDTFVYRRGLVGMEFSFSAAVGFFKSITGLILVLTVNTITKRLGQSEYGLF